MFNEAPHPSHPSISINISRNLSLLYSTLHFFLSLGILYQPAENWQNFLWKPTTAPISIAIGVNTSSDDPGKLSGAWFVYASTASSRDNTIQTFEVPLQLSKLATSSIFKNLSSKLIINMSDRIFQFLPNARYIV